MSDRDFPQPEDFRVYFAGQIMPAIVEARFATTHISSVGNSEFDEMAKKAVIAADALIAALKR